MTASLRVVMVCRDRLGTKMSARLGLGGQLDSLRGTFIPWACRCSESARTATSTNDCALTRPEIAGITCSSGSLRIAGIFQGR